ncbi:hypothetical protein HQ535_02360 [bacterium]|nr:hypothetical protein [bacterium]
MVGVFETKVIERDSVTRVRMVKTQNRFGTGTGVSVMIETISGQHVAGFLYAFGLGRTESLQAPYRGAEQIADWAGVKVG